MLSTAENLPPCHNQKLFGIDGAEVIDEFFTEVRPFSGHRLAEKSPCCRREVSVPGGPAHAQRLQMTRIGSGRRPWLAIAP